MKFWKIAGNGNIVSNGNIGLTERVDTSSKTTARSPHAGSVVSEGLASVWCEGAVGRPRYPSSQGLLMKFISTRLITADVNRLVAFYEMVTGTAAVWGNELFAEIAAEVATLAIGSDKTVPLFGVGSAEAAANRSAILEFLVEDVDAEFARLRGQLSEVVTEPTTMPWGNRALLFRDPDGNLVNLFTPVTDEARQKFGM